MTLRQALGADVGRLHDLLDELLDREDAVVLLFDGDRAINYINGFGLSPSQHELMALEIERMVRATGITGGLRQRGRRSQRDGRGARDQHPQGLAEDEAVRLRTQSDGGFLYTPVFRDESTHFKLKEPARESMSTAPFPACRSGAGIASE